MTKWCSRKTASMGSKNPKIKPRHKKTQETKVVIMGQTEKKETKHRVFYKHNNQLTLILTRIGTGKLLGGSQAHPSERQRCEVLSNATKDMTKWRVPFATREYTMRIVPYATSD
jgi:hypothetical protein